ncbi:MAG: hypothetical protein KC503_39015, partial [Myxococcales bacterium]|nr:hypothetical protein [Myxococcales bacterium]
MRALRDFYYGGVSGPRPPEGQWLPLSLARFRGAATLRSGYPLLLWFDERETGDARARVARAAEALGETLERAEQRGGGEMRLLRDNLVRLEQLLVKRGSADGAPALSDARAEIAAAGATLREQLGLREEHDESIGTQIAALCDALPEGAALLGESALAPLVALQWIGRAVTQRRRQALRLRVEQTIEQLRQLIWVDESKTTSRSDPETLAGTLGKTASAFDPTALASMLGRVRGAPPMERERRERIERVVETLRELAVEPTCCLLVVQRGFAAASKSDVLATLDGVSLVEADDVASQAGTVFDEAAARLAPVVAALRVAQLELEGRYSDTRHRSWLQSLDWRGFSDGELAMLPTVIGVCDERALEQGHGLSALSALLRSQRPVRLMVRCQTMPEPDDERASGETARAQLVSFGVAQRVGLVHQCAVAFPEQMVAGLERAARSERASLHLIADMPTSAGGAAEALPLTVLSGAQVASRAHPLLVYDPQGGASLARRVDFSGNPDPVLAWPREMVGGDNGSPDEEIAFTFADLALLSPAWRARMAVVDDTGGDGEAGNDERDLMPFDAFVEASLIDRAGRVPFIWGVDERGQRARLVIPRALALLAVDHAGSWRWLQELAGVRSEYVNVAVAQAVAQADARAAAERERLLAEHAAALEAAQREAA